MGVISNEMETLLTYLDELTDIYIRRLDFVRSGDFGKAKFIDERIEPAIWRKVNNQGRKISSLFKINH